MRKHLAWKLMKRLVSTTLKYSNLNVRNGADLSSLECENVSSNIAFPF